MLACAASRAFALSLLESRAAGGSRGDLPSLHGHVSGVRIVTGRIIIRAKKKQTSVEPVWRAPSLATFWTEQLAHWIQSSPQCGEEEENQRTKAS